jgi:hypothetical protein
MFYSINIYATWLCTPLMESLVHSIQWYLHICQSLIYIYIFLIIFRIALLISSSVPLKSPSKWRATKNSKAVSFCCEIYVNANKGSTRATSEINVGQCDRRRRHRTNEGAVPMIATRDVCCLPPWRLSWKGRRRQITSYVFVFVC